MRLAFRPNQMRGEQGDPGCGTTATVLRCILLILGSADEMVTNETLTAAKDCVHRGIPLPGVLQLIQLGRGYVLRP